MVLGADRGGQAGRGRRKAPGLVGIEVIAPTGGGWLAVFRGGSRVGGAPVVS